MRLSGKDLDYVVKLVEEMYDNEKIKDDLETRIFNIGADCYSSKKRGERLEEMDRRELLKLLLSMLARTVHEKGSYWD